MKTIRETQSKYFKLSAYIPAWVPSSPSASAALFNGKKRTTTTGHMIFLDNVRTYVTSLRPPMLIINTLPPTHPTPIHRYHTTIYDDSQFLSESQRPFKNCTKRVHYPSI